MCRYPSDWKLDGSHSKFNLGVVGAGEKKIAAANLLLSNVRCNIIFAVDSVYITL
jgi:hypothetical protein